MTREEAAELLSVPVTADAGEIRRRYQELYSDYQIRLTNAPTLSLRKTYQQNLQALEEACRLLLAGAPVDVQQYLPAAEPSYITTAAIPPASSAEYGAGPNTEPGGEREAERASEARRVRPCPACAEEILADALRCKHCGSAVEPLRDEAERRSASERAKSDVSVVRAKWLRRTAVFSAVIGTVLVGTVVAALALRRVAATESVLQTRPERPDNAAHDSESEGEQKSEPTQSGSASDSAAARATRNSGLGYTGNWSYTGPSSAEVRYLLTAVQNWSCPARVNERGVPPKPGAPVSSQRDEYVATAVVVSWGIECYARQGKQDMAANYERVLREVLQQANSLCSGTLGSPGRGSPAAPAIWGCPPPIR